MDVTPQVINEVEFHQKMRGYDPDEVDDFLERVAVAFEQMQERIRSAEQRVAMAEQRATEAPRTPAKPATADVEDTEAIRRTLVLAQRTADAAIKEAQDEAARILEGVQEQAQRMQAEAKEQARKTVVDAEADARKSADETRQRLIKEIIALEETRDALRADQGILERHLDEQRLRLRSSIGDLQRLLDDPARLRASTAPDLSGVTRPDFVDAAVERAETTELIEPTETDEVSDADDAGSDIDDHRAVIDLEAAEVVADEAIPQPRPKAGGVTFTPPDENNGSADTHSRHGSVAVATDEAEEAAWARFTQGDVDRPTMAVPALDADDDAYLSELRKAMLDDTSAGTLDPGEHRARTRFGRRR